MKVFIIFPTLRFPSIKDLGGYEFKSTALQDFRNEDPEIVKELFRLQHFFTQKGANLIDSFSYLCFEADEENLVKILEKIKNDLEIYRFLVLDPESSRSLTYEHTVPYICYPIESNPHYSQKDEEIYNYHIQVNFNLYKQYLSFSIKRKLKPFFNLIVSSSSPNHIKEDEYNVLREKSTEKSIGSLYWYHKTYSVHLKDNLEDLLRVSTAFESLLDVDRAAGKDQRLSELEDAIQKKGIEKLSTEQKKIIHGFLQEKLTSQYSKKIFEITESNLIENWFKSHFYPTGSSIRHGSAVSTVATKRDPGKRQKKEKIRSLYYGENASHHFLSNSYFAKKLFKFVFFELHYPSTQYVKIFSIEHLNNLLVSDEERLKKLEKEILETESGKLELKSISSISSLGGSYFGDKKRIYILLQKLLEELRVSFRDSWDKVEKDALVIAGTKAEDVPFDDHKGFSPYFSAIVEIESKLVRTENEYIDDDDIKFYSIQQFVSYALHNLL